MQTRPTKSQMTGYLMFLAMILAFYAGLVVVSAKEPVHHTELWWCKQLAPKYRAALEVRLDNNCRCDMVTDKEAIEVDWAYKKYEGVAQAIYYAHKLKKRPALILLVTLYEEPAQ